MSVIRTTADRIASFIVRHASAGSKEWAQAISAELSCIASDWQALAWSVGGLRVLFSIQPEPLQSIADLNEAARKHARSRLHTMNNGWIAINMPLFVVIASCLAPALGIVMGRDIPGHAALVAGYLFLTPLVYLRTREPDVPDSDDTAGLVRFYANEMSALSRYSISFWMFLAGGVMLTHGWLLQIAHGKLGAAVITCTSSLLLAFFLSQHVSYRRRYAQVQALLGKSPYD